MAAVVATNKNKWEEALAQLEEDDRKTFESISSEHTDSLHILENVLSAANAKKQECIRKRWKVKVDGHTIIVRDVLEKIAVWVNKVQSIGDIIVSFDPVHAALPWAAVRFLLQATVEDVQVFAFVVESLEKVAKSLAYCEIVEAVYISDNRWRVSTDLAAASTTHYAAVLSYLATILRYCGSSTIVRFVKAIGQSKTGIESKFVQISTTEEALRNLFVLAEAEISRAQLDKIALVQTQQEALLNLLMQFQAPIDRIAAQVADIDDGLQRETRAKILRAISTQPYMTHHKIACKGRLKDSGQWLLQKTTYKEWIESSSSSVLWLHGIPGSGKTKLASLIIDESQAHARVAYFYCARNPVEPGRAECDRVLASLVRQLSATGSSTPLLRPTLERFEDAIAESIFTEDQPWTAEECVETLLELFDEYPAVILVLDALDEVKLEDRQDLMDALSRLLTESATLIKIFICSRDNYDIALELKDSPNIYIEADDNAIDISAFIEDRLLAAKLLHGRISDHLRRDIIDTLLSKARGMFRWVDLQIQSLRPLKVEADIRTRLGSLPITLEESYWEIYQQIKESGEAATKLAEFTIHWLLQGKIEMFASNVARMASAALLDLQTSHYTEDEVMDVCANLIVLRQGSFAFAHLSVREFFEGLHTKRDNHDFLSEQSNVVLAGSCLRYLSSQLRNFRYYLGEKASGKLAQTSSEAQRYSDSREDISQTSGGNIATTVALEDMPTYTVDRVPGAKLPDSPYVRDDPSKGITDARLYDPVLRYSSNLWDEHIIDCGSRRLEEPVASLLKAFLLDGSEHQMWTDFVLWTQFVGRPWFFSKPDGSQQSVSNPPNPVWMAIEYDWYEVVQYLHEQHIDGEELFRDTRELDLPHGKQDTTPLEFAIFKGRIAIVRNIMHVGNGAPRGLVASSHESKTTGSHLLHAAVMDNGAPRGLVASSHEPNTTGSHLLHAAVMDNVEMLQLFLDQGDYNVDMEMAALRGAFAHNSPRTARVLLGRLTMSLDSKLGCFYIACSSKSQSMLQVMLQMDKDEPFLQHQRQGLCRAVGVGDIAMVGWLLDAKIGHNDLDDALALAVSNNARDIAKILVDHGAQQQPTAVSKVLYQDAPLSALRLIAAGFDISSKHFTDLHTPLHLAASRGYDDVVQLLLERGAEVDVTDRHHKTPLHLAAEKGQDTCVCLLLEHGADVLAEDCDGAIPLDLAELKGGRQSAEDVIREWMVKLRDELVAEKEKSAAEGNQQSVVLEDDGTVETLVGALSLVDDLSPEMIS